MTIERMQENMRYASPEVQEQWRRDIEYRTAMEEGDTETLTNMVPPLTKEELNMDTRKLVHTVGPLMGMEVRYPDDGEIMSQDRAVQIYEFDPEYPPAMLSEDEIHTLIHGGQRMKKQFGYRWAKVRMKFNQKMGEGLVGFFEPVGVYWNGHALLSVTGYHVGVFHTMKDGLTISGPNTRHHGTGRMYRAQVQDQFGGTYHFMSATKELVTSIYDDGNWGDLCSEADIAACMGKRYEWVLPVPITHKW